LRRSLVKPVVIHVSVQFSVKPKQNEERHTTS